MSLWLTLTYFTPCSDVYNVNFEHLIAGWERALPYKKIQHRFNRYHDVIQCCRYVVSLMFFLFIIKFLTLSLLACGPQEVKFVLKYWKNWCNISLWFCLALIHSYIPNKNKHIFNLNSFNFRAWCKSGTRTPGPRILGPWDPGPPSKFKSGTPVKFSWNL